MSLGFQIGNNLKLGRTKKEMQILLVRVISFLSLIGLLAFIIWGAVAEMNDRKTCREELLMSGFSFDRDGCYDFVSQTWNEACLSVQCDI